MDACSAVKGVLPRLVALGAQKEKKKCTNTQVQTVKGAITVGKGVGAPAEELIGNTNKGRKYIRQEEAADCCVRQPAHCSVMNRLDRRG